ncbi:unnamed protein product [Caenorhabditis auriculariae]|uniref:Uncharacterized protein n=1 Tax=Caenorhabditis auriculariae TaxID=2777116 RepID=A0A8S1GS17_9PELO|nr:unnamed protein product [Caenorhabditis auriculariae]
MATRYLGSAKNHSYLKNFIQYIKFPDPLDSLSQGNFWIRTEVEAFPEVIEGSVGFMHKKMERQSARRESRRGASSAVGADAVGCKVGRARTAASSEQQQDAPRRTPLRHYYFWTLPFVARGSTNAHALFSFGY